MNILFLCRENCKKSDAAYSYISKFKDWEITRIKESERGKAELPEILFPVDYIFCFRYPKILTKKQIEGAMEGAVNFHPAPPRYRGSGAINHALYNEDETFGVTAHMINDSIEVNPESVIWQSVETEYWSMFLKELVLEHLKETSSRLSKKIIDNFAEELKNFVQVCHKEMINKINHPISSKIKNVS